MNSDFLLHNAVYLGYAQNELQKIEPSSVSLSLWSPPYFVGKNYEADETHESWQAMLKAVIEIHASILKPGGFMVVNISDIICFKDASIPRFQALNPSSQKSSITREEVIEAKNKNPDIPRKELAKILGCSEQTVDRRLNGNNIRGGKTQDETRVKLVGSDLETYGYNAGIYLYDKRVWVKDPAWANSHWTSNSFRAVQEYEDLYVFWKPGQQVIDREKLTSKEWSEWGSRGVWNIRSVRANDDHEAKFPLELAEKIIRLFSNVGELIVDPFMGSGTSAVAAIKTERDFIGIEKEQKYVKLARENIEHAKIGMF